MRISDWSSDVCSSDLLYSVLAKFMGRIPGGLLHTNIVASGLFSSISGSSVATASTIGAAAMPSMRRYNYDERMAVGTLAAGGTQVGRASCRERGGQDGEYPGGAGTLKKKKERE